MKKPASEHAPKISFPKLGLLGLLILLLWFLPHSESLKNEGWHVLVVFIATLAGIVSKALPMGAIALISLAILAGTSTLPLSAILSGFSNSIVWLVVLAFFIAKSFIKTGLGMRIAYHFVGLLGQKSLGLTYGMACTDLFLAPAIPSNTARAGGIIFPIVKSLALAFDSHPHHPSHKRIGAFLILSAYHCNIITSAMFLTAMAANPLTAEIAKGLGIHLSWGTWALAGLVPGLASLLVIPFLLYKIYPPDIKETPHAEIIAKEHLKELGKVKKEEWITLAIFILMLFLWVKGPVFGIDSTTVALLGITALLVTGILSWGDLLKEESAWDTLFWFSTLLMLANQLNELGVIQWLASYVEDGVTKMGQTSTYLLLIGGYFYIHYFFASNTAHVSSLFAAFAVVGMKGGVPPYLLVFSLAFTSTLSACLTHYGTSPGPILYGAGYVKLGTWWKLGLIISLVHLVIWIGGGALWWKMIGLW